MAEDLWGVDRLDLEGYFARVDLPPRVPSRSALDELHERHVRTFSFDNIDVLLGQHPGVDLEAVQGKFVGRGRGGYCFEHSTLFAAVLQRLGYEVRRHLGRVGDPAAGTMQGRTHMTVEVVLDGERLLCDPGFGLSLMRPIPIADGAEEGHLGWRYRLLDTQWGWQLQRHRDGGWEVMHNTDELEVRPVDTVMGHYFTSTFPGYHFTTGLMLTMHGPDRHTSVSTDAVTVRRPGRPTEHRQLRDGELRDLLHELGVPLTPEEEDRLVARVAELRSRAGTT
ncbi:arylamine N-acetyltransferase family protein [Georgenia alba]|uniref:Arylamine N-acetyltransferase n=1 Tax=Georgenia alba TaxID=2233858 RepID=A0ABW2Q6S4_9MICO